MPMLSNAGSGRPRSEERKSSSVLNQKPPRSARSSDEELFVLHRSHAPTRGPFSLCMHRDDASTVSYTKVQAARDFATCQYFVGSPCEQLTFELAELTYERSSLA